MTKPRIIELKLPLFILLVVFSIVGVIFAMTIFGAVYKALKYKKAKATTTHDSRQMFQFSPAGCLIPNNLIDFIKKEYEILYSDTLSKYFVNRGHPSDSRIVLIINPLDDSVIVFYDYIFGCKICPAFTLFRANVKYDYYGRTAKFNSIIRRELSWQEYLTFEKSEGGEISSENK